MGWVLGLGLILGLGRGGETERARTTRPREKTQHNHEQATTTSKRPREQEKSRAPHNGTTPRQTARKELQHEHNAARKDSRTTCIARTQPAPLVASHLKQRVRQSDSQTCNYAGEAGILLESMQEGGNYGKVTGRQRKNKINK